MSTPEQPSTRVNTTFQGIREMHPGKETAPRDPRPARVLAVVHDHAAMIISWQGYVIEVEIQNVGQDRLLIDSIETHHLEDGVWVWEGRYVRTGSSDWGHAFAEGELQGEWRRASEAEWHHAIAGEHVWEVPPAEPPPTATELLDDVEDALRTASAQLTASRRLVRESQEQLDNIRRADASTVRLGNGG